ncbi:MAG: hypothetical protein ACYC3S_18115 [Chloroflexota bacterium]
MRENPRGLVSAIVGLTMIALGLLFLVDQLLPVSIWRYSWPFFVLIPGLLFFVGMGLGGRGADWLAVPGSIITMVGLILLFQNLTGHWRSWAYAWALVFPTALGVGLYIQGAWSGQPALTVRGLRWTRLGAVLFVIGGVFFEVVLDFSRGGIGRVVWPLVLILAGAYLLLRRGELGMNEAIGTPRAADVPPPTGPRPDQPPPDVSPHADDEDEELS